MSDADLKAAEESKRLRAVDPLERWLQLQCAIDWAIAAMPPSEWKPQRRLKQERMELEKARNAPKEQRAS